jgi:hypothetical protein
MYMDLGRNKEAEVDLQAVCLTVELFPGTLSSSLVGLGELARRTGDVSATREYLDVATSSEDADDETLVEALFVWARALTKKPAPIPKRSGRVFWPTLMRPSDNDRFAENRGLT